MRPQIQNLKSWNQAFESTQLRVTKVFFSSIIFSQLRLQIEFKLSQVCYFMHSVDINQARRLVFDKLPKVSSVIKCISLYQTQSQHSNTTCFCLRYFTVRFYYSIEKHKTVGPGPVMSLLARHCTSTWPNFMALLTANSALTIEIHRLRASAEFLR